MQENYDASIQAIKKQAQSLVEAMTTDEKLSQMLYNSSAIPRLNIPAYNWWNEALHGVARAGVATIFPQAIAIAAMFDEPFTKLVASAIADEGRARYTALSNKNDRDIYKGLTFWSPNINIFRDPRWGRGHETYGEDPYLTAQTGKAFVQGLQGEHPVYLKASACAKHFAVHSGPEASRHSFNAKVNAKDLFETYLYAFEELVKAGVSGVMGAYNAVNGEPCCGSPSLLKDILKEQWGFDGYVPSDCGALDDFHQGHGVTNSALESAVLAIQNSCDLDYGNIYKHLSEALRNGLITEKQIDEAVTRLLTIRLRLGILGNEKDSPYDISYDVVACEAHKKLALEAAEKSMVLLENNGILPLIATKLTRVAVIGPNANNRSSLIGNYHGTASRYITALEGIQDYLSSTGVEVRFAEGCHLYKEQTESLAQTQDRLAEAVIEAERADAVVLCLGLDETLEGEEGDAGNSYASGDKTSLLLPESQQRLLNAVLETGVPTIVVLFSGSALAVEDHRLAALIQAWYPGEQGGKALARLLFGDVNPSGRLPVTFYHSDLDLPDFKDYSMKGRTYRYFLGKPLYPFGYGLSYTKFRYEKTKCFSTAQGYDITTLVKNSGVQKGREVVQVYVAPPLEEENQPHWSLKGYCSVELNPAEQSEVMISLPLKSFLLFAEDGSQYYSKGTYRVFVGGSQPSNDTVGIPICLNAIVPKLSV